MNGRKLPTPEKHCRTLRLYIFDSDNFQGGRKESISVAGNTVGEYESFRSGRWIEVPISAAETPWGRISVVARNLRDGSNAVVSLVRFVKR